MREASRKLVIVLAALACAAGSFAQQIYLVDSSKVTTPPPRIEFPEWSLADSGEFHREYHETFASAATTGYPENDRIKLRVFLPTKKGPVPSVILLNYWGASDQTLEEGLAKRLTARGIAAVLMPLPYHLSRTPKGFRSGQRAIGTDPKELIETTVQSNLDIRRTLDFIQSRPEFDPNAIGISGTSLGAIVGSLSFALDHRVKAASFSLGGIDFARIFWRSSVVVEQREKMRIAGWTEEKLREAMAPVEPGAYLQPLGERKALVVVAKHDQVIPASAAKELIDKLETASVVTLESGHYGGFFAQNEVLRTIATYFDAVLHDREFVPPSSLNAPTIRVGLAYNPESGAQVAVGMDLWRSGNRWYAAPMLTPKGIQGFIGYQVHRQVSVGAAITGRKTTWGIAWNVIL